MSSREMLDPNFVAGRMRPGSTTAHGSERMPPAASLGDRSYYNPNVDDQNLGVPAGERLGYYNPTAAVPESEPFRIGLGSARMSRCSVRRRRAAVRARRDAPLVFRRRRLHDNDTDRPAARGREHFRVLNTMFPLSSPDSGRGRASTRGRITRVLERPG